MIKRLFFLFLIMISVNAYSQKKEISQARQSVKNNNNLGQAEEAMRKLLKDSVNRNNEKIWLILFDAVRKQYNDGNEKLYLKNNYDTALLFNSARKMFEVLEGLDSIDAQPDKKGVVKLKYRKKHAEFLNKYRRNIYSGGLFFARKQNYSQAYDFFDTYIDCTRQPLFSNYDYTNTDSLLLNAAYMTVYCGFKQKDVAKTLKYADLAMTDTANLKYLYQYFAETCNMQGDTSRYETLLLKGFHEYPRSKYFFPRLFDFYFKNGKVKQALSLCDDALKTDSMNIFFNFAKSTALLKVGKYDECIKICDDLIARNDTLAEAYLNAGLAYFNQTVRSGAGNMTSRKDKAKKDVLYKSAMPYLQRYRILAPNNKDKWGIPLYTIYLNLNMGKEFEEIEALLKKNDDDEKK